MEGFLTRESELILPGCGRTSALSQRPTLAARWFHEPQPRGNMPVGLGFPHLAGRHQPGGSAFSAPGYLIRRDIERFLNRGWEIILPGCGGTSALLRGATLAACWLHERQPISNHPVGLGFPYPAGRHRPGRSAFTSPDCRSCRDTDFF